MLRRSFLAGAAASALLHAAPPVRVLVQGAVDTELQPLLDALSKRKETRIQSWTFWEGSIDGKRIVVSRTDVGPINAVASTVLGIERYRPQLVINQGTAGAHNRDLKLWDIVLGEKTIEFAACKTEHRPEGAGVVPVQCKPLPHRLRLDGKDLSAFDTFPGDTKTINVALQHPYTRGRLRKGTVGSAYQWNRELDMLDAIHKRHGTDTEDMESAYAHGAAIGLKTPFLAIRIVSDSEFNHPNFEKIAGQYCAEYTLGVIRRLVASK